MHLASKGSIGEQEKKIQRILLHKTTQGSKDKNKWYELENVPAGSGPMDFIAGSEHSDVSHVHFPWLHHVPYHIQTALHLGICRHLCPPGMGALV
jgi:hypothetical protein